MRELDSSVVVECRTIKDWPCSEKIAPREVRLASGGGPVLAAQRLGGALAEEIDLEGGVDRDEAVLDRDVALVVGVVDGPELDARILLHELIQSLASDRVGRNDFVSVGALAGAVDHTFLDQVDEPVREKFGVDPKIFMA